MTHNETSLVNILLIAVGMCIHPVPAKATVISQSINRLDFTVEGTDMYGVSFQEIDRIRRERIASTPACPILAGYWWNLDCA